MVGVMLVAEKVQLGDGWLGFTTEFYKRLFSRGDRVIVFAKTGVVLKSSTRFDAH
jgi:hypothetical protein